MNLLFTTFCIGMVFLGAPATGNAQELLTFDDMTAGGGLGPYPAVPNGFGGLNWDNFAVINGLEVGPTYGYYTGVVSPSNVAFNSFGNPSSIAVSSGLFDLDSAYLTSALNSVPTQNIQVQGFVGTTMLYNNTYTVNNSGPTLINFGYTGIESVTFTSGGQQFAMDNLTVTVPEPGTIGLLVISSVVVGLGSLRKRIAKESKASEIERLL